MQSSDTSSQLEPILDLVSQRRWGDNALVLSLPVLTRDTPRRVRTVVRTTFAGTIRGTLLLDLLLAASELLTNAVVHGSAPAMFVMVHWPDRTALAVHDASTVLPTLDADPRSGLAIIDNLSEGGWGVHSDGQGKWVWAILRCGLPMDDSASHPMS